MAQTVRATEHPQIPDKLYFRVGEVSKLIGVKPYVLRYWESEFPTLSPKKSGTGHRLYRKKDIELLFEIRSLLHEQRFTIEGARQKLSEKKKAKAAPPPPPPPAAPDPEPEPEPEIVIAPKPRKPRQRLLFEDPDDTVALVRHELRSLLKLLT